MQAEGVEMHGGGQALDVVQATKRSCAARRGPGSVICTEPNTPVMVEGLEFLVHDCGCISA